MWTILSWIIFGFVAGLIARAIMPGDQGGLGYIKTTILGLIGAALGGFLGNLIFHGTFAVSMEKGVFDFSAMATAVIGALIVLFAYIKLFENKN